MANRYCTYCLNPLEREAPCPVCGRSEGAYAPLPHHLPPGTMLLGRYLIGRVLGEGGFGITYIGLDLRLELRVAIKEYFPTDRVTRMSQVSLCVTQLMGAEDDGFQRGKERFLYEARTLARMEKQPEIVTVRDYFEENGTAYIVMEYVEGTTFKSWVKQNGGRIPPEELFSTIEPLFGALDAVHRSGLIHRDISPDNLMLENGMVRLLDFGCARESAGGTKTMTVALKHGFAPVEQYQYKGQGPWTDVYSLAATIYYCLTGETPPQALDRMCDDELIPPQKLGIPLSEQQERALLRGLGIRPRRRFQSVEEFRAALYAQESPPESEPEEPAERQEAPAKDEAALEESRERVPEPPASREEKQPGTRHLPRWAIPAAAGVVAVGLLGTLLLPKQAQPQPEPDPDPDPPQQETLLEDAEDLETAPDSDQQENGWNQVSLNNLRTDSAIFADARQVSTVEELHSAMEDPEVSAISICAPIALTSNVRQTKPVLVTAEATVTMVGTVPYSWKVLGSYLKNAGQMEINLQANGSAAVTNEGIMKLKDAQLSEASGFFNQGSVIAEQLVFCGGSQGFNLGEAEVQEIFRVTAQGTAFSNSGRLTVHSWVGVEACGRLENRETMILAEGTQLFNNAVLFNSNILELRAGSSIENAGLLDWYVGEIIGNEEAAIRGDGILMYHSVVCTITEEMPVASPMYFAEEFSFTTFDAVASTDGGLQSNMLQQRSTELSGKVLIQGDLAVTEDLFIPAGSSLEVTGALTVAPGATIYNDGSLTAAEIAASEAEPWMALYNQGTVTAETLHFSHQALFLNDGAAEISALSLTDSAMVSQGTLRCAGKMELQRAQIFCAGETDLERCEVAASQSGLLMGGAIAFTDASLLMQQNTAAIVTSAMDFSACTMDIGQGASVDIQHSDLTFDEKTTITNSGTLILRGLPSWSYYPGVLRNTGTMEIHSRYLAFYGTFENNGTVELWENASIRFGDDSIVSGTGAMVQKN